MKRKEKLNKLKDLKKKMKKADLPLKDKATNLVFAAGDADADIMFIGEGPGYWEDQKAVPFVGKAGAFLNQMLREVGIKREEVFITNVIHYRPPNNRDPEPEELKAFKPYLDKMIDIVNPMIIATLGRFSMAKFIPGVKISDVHGKPRMVKWGDRKVLIVPMYHPAAGLRNGEIKRRTMEDFKILPEILKDPKKYYNDKVEEKRNKERIDQMQLI